MHPDREIAWLRLRMAAVTALAVLAVVGVAWWHLERLGRENTAAVSRVSVVAASESFLDLMRSCTDELRATIGALAANEELAAAVATRDHRRLLAAAGPTFHDLRQHHGITHWNYWEPEVAGSTAVRGLRNVARLGTPTIRGDFVERETLARVAREKATVTGLELGYTGFVLRALAPVRAQGRLVGYVELGRDLGTLLADMKQRTGDDFALVLDKRRIDAGRWAAARAARGERNDWADSEGLVLVRYATHGEGVLTDAVLPEDIPDQGAPLGLHGHGARVYARGAFPLRDAGGSKVGAVYVFRDVTELAARAQALRRGALAALALAALAAVVAVSVAFERLAIRPRRGAAATRAPAEN